MTFDSTSAKSQADPTAEPPSNKRFLWPGLVGGVVSFAVLAAGFVVASGALEPEPTIVVAKPSESAPVPIEDEALERSQTIIRQLEREVDVLDPRGVARMWAKIEKTQESPTGRDLDEYGVLEVRKNARDNAYVMVISTTRSLCSVVVQLGARAEVASLRCGAGIKS